MCGLCFAGNYWTSFHFDHLPPIVNERFLANQERTNYEQNEKRSFISWISHTDLRLQVLDEKEKDCKANNHSTTKRPPSLDLNMGSFC